MTGPRLLLSASSSDVAAAVPSGLLPVWVIVAAALIVFIGLLATGVAIGSIADKARGTQARRRRGLAAYTLSPRAPARQPPPPTRLGDNPVTRSAVDLADRLVRSRNAEDSLTRRLEAADLPLRPGEWVIIQVGIAAAVGLLLLALSGGNPVALVAGLILGGVGSTIFLSTRLQRRRDAFHTVLPDTLGLLASTLRVGYSLPQAMDAVVRDGREPIRAEFNRALVETRLGVPAERSLDSIADRLDSDDFRWVVMAIRIQREVGGNLAELLETVAETMRERARLQRQVAALSAEGRLSAWIIGGLPVVFVIYLILVRPAYLAPLVTEPLGLLMVAIGLALFVIGVVGLRWAIKVDV